MPEELSYDKFKQQWGIGGAADDVVPAPAPAATPVAEAKSAPYDDFKKQWGIGVPLVSTPELPQPATEAQAPATPAPSPEPETIPSAFGGEARKPVSVPEAFAPTPTPGGSGWGDQPIPRVPGLTPQGEMGTVERLGRHFAGGALGTAEGLGGALQWLSGGALGKDFSDYMSGLRKEVTPEGEASFIDQLASGAGSMATFFIPGFGVGRAAGILGKVAPRAASWLGAGTMAVTEAATEAGQVFRDELTKGKDEGKAGGAAAWTFWLNLPVLALTDKLGFFPGDQAKALRRALRGMVTEGSQESLQEVISTWSQEEQQNLKNILTSGAVGAIIGGGTAAIAKPAGLPQEQKTTTETEPTTPPVAAVEPVAATPPVAEVAPEVAPGAPTVPRSAPTPEIEATFGTLPTAQADAVRELVPRTGSQESAERFFELYSKGDVATAQKEFPELALGATEQQKRAAYEPTPMASPGLTTEAVEVAPAPEKAPPATPAETPRFAPEPPAPEPPSSAPAMAGGGGTVGLSATPAPEKTKAKAAIPEALAPTAPMGNAGSAAENVGKADVTPDVTQNVTPTPESTPTQTIPPELIGQPGASGEVAPESQAGRGVGEVAPPDTAKEFIETVTKDQFNDMPVFLQQLYAEKYGVPKTERVRDKATQKRMDAQAGRSLQWEGDRAPDKFYPTSLDLYSEIEKQVTPTLPPEAPGGVEGGEQELINKGLLRLKTKGFGKGKWYQYKDADNSWTTTHDKEKAVREASKHLISPTIPEALAPATDMEAVREFNRTRGTAGTKGVPKDLLSPELRRQQAADRGDLWTLIRELGGINSKSEIWKNFKREENNRLFPLKNQSGLAPDVMADRLNQEYPHLAGFDTDADLLRFLIDGNHKKLLNKNILEEEARYYEDEKAKETARGGFSAEDIAADEDAAERELAAEEIAGRSAEPGEYDTSWDFVTEPKAPGPTPGAQKTSTRLTALQEANPDLDAKSLELVLKTFPDAIDADIARMAKDPKVFDQLRRQRLQKMSDSGGDSDQMQSLGMDTGKLFRVEDTTSKYKLADLTIEERLAAFQESPLWDSLTPDQQAEIMSGSEGGEVHPGIAKFFQEFSGPGIGRHFMQPEQMALHPPGYLDRVKLFKVMGWPSVGPEFYSQMARTLEAKLPGKGSGAQLADTIEKWAAKGRVDQDNPLSAAELKWSGLVPWLREQQGTVTKQQVAEFLKENQVEVREVVKGSTPPPLEWEKHISGRYWTSGEYTIEQLPTNGMFLMKSMKSGIQKAWDTLEKAQRQAEALNRADSKPATKFQSYLRLPSSWVNGREMLLTLPAQTITEPKRFGVGTREVQGDVFTVPSSHAYGDPAADVNRFAHVFLADYTDPATGKKYLVVTELQSDWAASGRKYGYKEGLSSEEKNRVKELESEIDALWVKHKELVDSGKHTEAREVLENEINPVTNTYAALEKKESGAPPLPFAKNWMEVALKKTLRKAAEEGYAGVMWPNGDMVKERYDLSKQVEGIEYKKNPDDTFNIRVIAHGEEAISKDNLTTKELEDTVGKDITQRMIEGKRSEGLAVTAGYNPLTGLDLKVGGEWANRQYDGMMPQFLGKYGKQWGSRVSRINIGEEQSRGESFPDSGSIDKYASLSLDPMDRGMSAAINNDEVAKAVVNSLPVNVVELLLAKRINLQDFVRNPKMFIDNLPIESRLSVTNGIRDSLAKNRTLLGAGLNSAYKTGLDKELLPALRASDLDTNIAAWVAFPENFGSSTAIPGTNMGMGVGRTSFGTEATSLLGSNEGVPTKLADFVKWHENIVSHVRGDVNRVWGIDFTPQMIESVMGGQPLFRALTPEQVTKIHQAVAEALGKKVSWTADDLKKFYGSGVAVEETEPGVIVATFPSGIKGTFSQVGEIELESQDWETLKADYKLSGETLPENLKIAGQFYKIDSGFAVDVVTGMPRQGFTLAHEGIGHMVFEVFATPKEQKALIKKWGNVDPSLDATENIANALGQEYLNWLRSGGKVGTPENRTLFQKVYDFFVKFLDAIHPTWRSVMRSMQSGEMFGRTPEGWVNETGLPEALAPNLPAQAKSSIPESLAPTRPESPEAKYLVKNTRFGGQDPTVSRVEDMFERTETAFKELRTPKLKEHWENLKRMTIDTSANIKKELIAKGGDAGHRVEIAHDVSRGASAKGEMIFREAEDKIYKGLSKADEIILNRIIQARRVQALESYKPDLMHPEMIGAAEYQAYLDSIPQDVAANLMPRADEYFSAWRENLIALREAGLINDEEFDAMVNHEYSPRQFIQHIDPEGTGFDARGRKITVPESGIKSLKEGSDQLLNMDSRLMLAEGITRTQARIFKNNANLALYDMAQQVPDNGFVRIDPDKPGDHETQIKVMIDGQPTQMIMPDKFAREWVQSDPMISAQMATILGYATGSKILRATATGMNPGFAITNIFRDLAHIWLTTHEYSSFAPKYTLQIGKDIMEVMGDAIRRKGAYKQYINEGGGMSFLTNQGQEQRLTGAFGKIQHYLGWIGETSEILTRLALRNRAIKNRTLPDGTIPSGATLEATWEARNYLDFSQGGSFSKAVDSAVPYLNASIQGTRGIFRAARTDPKLFTWKVAQIGALATGLYLANTLINPDGWDEIPENEKVTNWIITTPFSYIDEMGNKRYHYIRIAKDQGQRIFASAFEGAIGLLQGKKVDGDQIASAMTDFLPVIPSEKLPPMLQGMLGYYANKDFWRNKDIWQGPKVEASEEYTKYTHPVLIKAGELTGASPERMGYFAGSIVPATNTFVALVGGGIKSLVSDLPEKDRQSILETISKPITSKFLRTTDPYTPYAKDIDELSVKESTTKLKQRRGLEKLIDANIDRSSEERQQIYSEYIAQQDPADMKRLIREVKNYEAYHELPDRRWWLKLSHLDPEVRAEAFYNRYKNADPDEQERFTELGKKLPGINSERFREKLYQLDNNLEMPQAKESDVEKGLLEAMGIIEKKPKGMSRLSLTGKSKRNAYEALGF